MSNKINTQWPCTKCGCKYNVSLYRSIWGEVKENRDLVMNDKINMETCPKCGFVDDVPLAFMYTHKEPDFAIWYEPFHDASIDEEKLKYSSMPGMPRYLMEAPRISDWNEFKKLIILYEKGRYSESNY